MGGFEEAVMLKLEGGWVSHNQSEHSSNLEIRAKKMDRPLGAIHFCVQFFSNGQSPVEIRPTHLFPQTDIIISKYVHPIAPVILLTYKHYIWHLLWCKYVS